MTIFSFELHLSTPIESLHTNVVMTTTKKSQRKTFSPSEDYLLKRLVEIHGDKNWEQISKYLDGRNARACRERWRLNLSPGIVNGPWSHEEDMLLVKRVQEIGPKWKLLSKEFIGRSECNIKNRWARHLKDMINKDPKIFDEQAITVKPTVQTNREPVNMTPQNSAEKNDETNDNFTFVDAPTSKVDQDFISYFDGVDLFQPFPDFFIGND